MTFKTTTALFAAFAIAIGAASLARAQTADQGRHGSLIELAANNNNKKTHKNISRSKTTVKTTSGSKTTVRTFKAPKTTVRTKTTIKKFSGPKTTVRTKTTVKKFNAPKTTVKTFNAPKTGIHKYGSSSGSKYNKPKTNVRVITPKHSFSMTVTGKRMRGLPRTGYGHFYVRGRNFSTWRGARYRRRYHDRWVTFVPLSVLAAILYRDRYYYPYAYISAPEDYCYGRTEDGCYLRWEEIETLEGYHIGQCVAYCPWRG